MAKPFDATLKELVETYPLDWVTQLGFPPHPVEVIDADLSTVTTQADRVVRVADSPAWLLNLELQSSRDPTLVRRMLKYHVLLHDRHELAVQTVAVLLRPEALYPELTGAYRTEPPHGRSGLDFRFEVYRVWEQPVESILEGGLGTLPLAPLAAVPRERLPAVIDRMEGRLDREVDPPQAATLWTSTYILMGLRYPPEVAGGLLQGVRAMKESSTYQAILEEGAVAQARKGLLLLGTKRFGQPDARIRESLTSLTDLTVLDRLVERLLNVESWEELLGQP